jgi:hypothetical protein
VQKIPIQWYQADYFTRERYLDKRPEYRDAARGPNAVHTEKMNIDAALKFILEVNEKTCKK